MSQTHDDKPESDLPTVDETPVEETPAVAGGDDDSQPEQGEGESNSF